MKIELNISDGLIKTAIKHKINSNIELDAIEEIIDSRIIKLTKDLKVRVNEYVDKIITQELSMSNIREQVKYHIRSFVQTELNIAIKKSLKRAMKQVK